MEQSNPNRHGLLEEEVGYVHLSEEDEYRSLPGKLFLRRHDEEQVLLDLMLQE